MTVEWEDDHPTQRSLPAVRLSEIRETRREAPLEGPPTIPSSPPFPSFPGHLPDPPSSGAMRGDAPISHPLSLARPTLVSPSDAPEMAALSESEPSTVPSALLPHIPPPPRSPSDLAGAVSGDSLRASAALPLVSVEVDQRATIEAVQAPAPLSSLCALERQLVSLRRRTLWLTVACALSIALSLALAAISLSR